MWNSKTCTLHCDNCGALIQLTPYHRFSRGAVVCNTTCKSKYEADHILKLSKLQRVHEKSNPHKTTQ